MIAWLSSIFSKTKIATRPLTAHRFSGVGINDYHGTANDLRGCIYDAYDWRAIAVYEAQFRLRNCSILKDAQCTKQRILDHWRWAIEGIEPGQLSLITVSSHGAQVPDRSGDEDDKLDECICTYDFAWDDQNTYITDDEIAETFSGIPRGALVVMIIDACHSGTMQRSIQIRETARCIPVPRSARQHKITRIGASARAAGEPNNFILISGCKSDEFSFDAVFNGAFTHTAINVIKDSRRDDLTYEELIKRVNKVMPFSGQHPQLHCTPDLAKLQVFKEALS